MANSNNKNNPSASEKIKMGHGPISDSTYYKLRAQQNNTSKLSTPKKEEKIFSATPKTFTEASEDINTQNKSTTFETSSPKRNNYYRNTFSPAGRIKETFTSMSNNSSNTSMNTPEVNDRLNLGHGPISNSKYYEMKAQQNRQNSSFGTKFNVPKREEKFLPAYEPKKAEYSFPVRKEDYLQSIRKNNKPGSGYDFPYSKKDYLRLAEKRANNPEEKKFVERKNNFNLWDELIHKSKTTAGEWRKLLNGMNEGKTYQELRDEVDLGIFENFFPFNSIYYNEQLERNMQETLKRRMEASKDEHVKETLKSLIKEGADNPYKPIQRQEKTEDELHYEFAVISEDIYGATVEINSTGIKAYEECEPIPGITWRMVDGEWGNVSMKVGVYTKEKMEGQPEEYVIAFRGTPTKHDNMEEIADAATAWPENIFQRLSPLSTDMWEAIIYAQQFVKAHPDAKITFVGHSKGGAEALMAAVVTDKDAVVFNPAQPNFWGYGFSTKHYKGKAISYIVRGDILNGVVGEPGVGEVRYVGEYDQREIDGANDHSMEAFRKFLDRER